MAKAFLTIVEIKLLPGFAYGLRSPSLQITLEVNNDYSLEPIPLLFEELGLISPEFLLGLSISKSEFSVVKMFESLLIILSNIFKQAKVPVFDKGFLVLDSNAKQANRFTILVPTCTYGDQYTVSVLRCLFELVNKAVAHIGYQADLATIKKIYERPKFLRVFGSNFIHFLSAAYQLGIQVSFVCNKVFQFGQGRNGSWMESSFTEDTSHLGVQIAQNKMATSAVLKSAGLPVPNHKFVKNQNDAIIAAQKIGYPVVIKPLDLDGGIGVAADIRTEKELKLAYAETNKRSSKILVEKHIVGKDYRINVFHDKVLWAIERIYAGVWGDGINSVKFLIEEINSDARRGINNQSPLKKLIVDKEMLDFLESRGLSLESIPERNQFVQLRRRGNIASGGLPIQVMDKIHEDNKMLAIRAARAMKLDLAGVDLIIPDIAKSWMEVGGGICEVNAQPQLGSVTSAHCYKEVLQGLLTKDGRVPIIVTVGEDLEVFSHLAATFFEKKHIEVGLYFKSGLFISNKLISNQASDFYSAGTILCRDKSIGVMILQLKDLSILRQGLPFDRFDALLVGDLAFVEKSNSEETLDRLIGMLIPACEGNVYMNSEIKKSLSGHINSKVFLKTVNQINSKSFVKEVCEDLLSNYH